MYFAMLLLAGIYEENDKNIWLIWELNPGPSACKADVIPITPMNHLC